MESPLSLDQFTSDEYVRLCWVRAIEWIAWPAFLSQPILPILYIFYPTYWVLLAFVSIAFFWLPIRHRFASLRLATLGFFWVRLKWLTIPVGAYLLFRQQRYIAVAIATLTPFIASWLNFPAQLFAARLGFPSQLGVVQQRFMSAAEKQWPT